MIAILPLAALAMVALNLATWRPLRRRAEIPRASALVPARDEERTIEACVRSLLAEPFAEVVVCDDGSTDDTAGVLARIADPRLRVIRGEPLRPGWVGKPHACDRLAREATTDLFVFVDADVTFEPGGLALLRGALPGDVLSLLPRQRLESLGERLIVPLMHLVYTSFLWLPLVGATKDPRVLAVNGQVLAITRSAYDTCGGWEAVRGAIVDDMAFCRNAKSHGLRVDFADGQGVASCRMYGSGREAVAGFAKNLLEGVGSPAGLAAFSAVWLACFLAPWLTWPIAPAASAVGIAANLVTRALLSWRFAHGIVPVVLHPLSIVAFVLVAARSWGWSRRNAIAWKGRTYPARTAREAS